MPCSSFFWAGGSLRLRVLTARLLWDGLQDGNQHRADFRLFYFQADWHQGNFELKKENRLKFIILSVAVAELSLVLFGRCPGR